MPLSEGWVKVSPENFWEVLDYKPINLDEYDSVVLFGDIHGCLEPLKDYFKANPFNEKTKYIFVGDYVDRGIQNKETLEFLLELSKKENVTFLEGNHEIWLRYFAAEEYDKIKSKEFRDNTMPQLFDLNKSQLREFTRRLNQIMLFKYREKTYFVSHGGLNAFPEHLPLISTEQLIKGVGRYATEIDNIWEHNETNIIQIHGHRNINPDKCGTNRSINLEGKIEFGGNLHVCEITSNGILFVYKYKNNVYKTINTEDFQKSELVKEKVLGNGISSFNFTRDAFIKSEWNELTCKARGLFMDVAANKVVARGYEKFFNINEVPETKLANLPKKLKGPITCYKKENGFLGILSYVNNELMFCSKSTNTGDYAGYFKTLFEQSDIDKQAVINFLKDGWFSLVFEVIDIENDPHIIEYDKSKIVLLDAIENKMDFERLPYNKLVELANNFNCEVKTIYKQFENFEQFNSWLTNLDSKNFTDIEGVVIESGDFMCKLKFDFYLFWKYMRGIVQSLKANGSIKKIPESKEGLDFYNWIVSNPELWDKDIISLRNIYEKRG